MRVLNERVLHPERSFRLLRIEARAFDGPRHRHPQLELTWIQRGDGIRYVGDSVAPFAAGDMVLLGAGLAHTWISDEAGRARTAVAYVLQFPASVLEQPGFPELDRARSFAQLARHGLQISGSCAEAISVRLSAMVDAGPLARLASFLDILALLVDHPQCLHPIATSAGQSTSAGVHRRIDRVIERVTTQLHRRLSAAELARVAGVSPAAFSRFFRREAGKPFSTYLNDVRCGEACLQLRKTLLPVATIAENCGFSSLSHFNRQFRRRLGMTPRQYRSGRRRARDPVTGS